MRAAWPDRDVVVEACRSQIGSGALPVDLLASAAVTLAGKGLDSLARELRALPRPVIGRINDGRLWLDCRCLEPDEEGAFLAQLPKRRLIGRISQAEEKRPRWVGRTSNPVGVAERSWAGSNSCSLPPYVAQCCLAASAL